MNLSSPFWLFWLQWLATFFVVVAILAIGAFIHEWWEYCHPREEDREE